MCELMGLHTVWNPELKSTLLLQALPGRCLSFCNSDRRMAVESRVYRPLSGDEFPKPTVVVAASGF